MGCLQTIQKTSSSSSSSQAAVEASDAVCSHWRCMRMFAQAHLDFPAFFLLLFLLFPFAFLLSAAPSAAFAVLSALSFFTSWPRPFPPV